MRIFKTALSSTGEPAGNARIAAGDVDKTSDWSFSADDSDKLLGANGDDWTTYAKWFLGTDPEADSKTKAHYKYPFGKGGKVYRSGLIAIRSRAAQQDATAIFDAAGRMIDKIDGKAASVANRKQATAPGMRQVAWSQFKLLKVYDPGGDGEDDSGVCDPNSPDYDPDECATLQDGYRYLEGIATTPTPDRMGDVVDPAGCMYSLPLPFLWQHDSTAPIGNVTACVHSAAGITVKVAIPKTDVPGVVKDRLDEAYQSIKMGLVRGLSIGFAPLEYAYMEDTGGYRFARWEWLELSAVTIPANMEATIATIKSMDNRRRKATPVVRLSATSRAITSQLAVPRLKMQGWCDASSESVDEIIAARERAFK
jgi:HK97 family phage prohead protease